MPKPVTVVLAGAYPAGEAVLRALNLRAGRDRCLIITKANQAPNIRGLRNVDVYELIGWDLRLSWDQRRYVEETLQAAGITKHVRIREPEDLLP